jgi:3-oxoacyl-[acyl-carrier-protein] synthase-3
VLGLKNLFARKLLAAEDIDALLLVTQTPDYLVPPTSNIIQGILGLKRDMICLDINQACAGFVLGLIEAFMLLEQESVRKVVLINADVLSRKACPQDRNIYPLIGDAAAITIIERSGDEAAITAIVKMDGSQHAALIIPAGGMRMPNSPETAKLEDVGDRNLRAKDHLYMDGSAIFNFVQTEIPPLIEELAASTGLTLESIDYFLCHQPNRFMLQKLADKMKVPHARMPHNVVENFGNTSGSTIPLALALNFNEQLRKNSYQVCLAGFGAGLSWAAMIMKLGPLQFCELIEYP